jgi:DNA uptake protein ComE-like DNA-binding protein
MKFFKSHFWYNKSQRNGVFFLLAFIVGFQFIYFFVDLSSKELTLEEQKEISFFQSHLDSLALQKAEKKPFELKPFNPSFLDDYKGEQLGMSIAEIDRLLLYRKGGNYINSVKHFQVVTLVSDSLLASISPHFKFPDWIENKKKVTSNYKNRSDSKTGLSPNKKRDLNLATAIELKEIYGIGETLSVRIIKYRTSIKGFLDNDQISEVYGLKKEVLDELLQHFTVLSKPKIEKLNLNTATFKEVLHLPYIDYELTKKIFQYKDEYAEIQSIEELKNIEGFPLELFDRIALYLRVK